MHGLPRQLTVEQLAELFEGRTRFVERLADEVYPLEAAHELIRRLPEEELREALDAHPAIGAESLSERSAGEQGDDSDEATMAELARLNGAYEEKFGFRFVVFVNRRPKAQILEVLRARLERSREDELHTAMHELVAIAQDRWRRS
ncbi:MAG: 2-oxo-4-hydroxy-4-carboxy-5-ureidoimidazoline decarboxylase [Gaiellaceae bacterium]